MTSAIDALDALDLPEAGAVTHAWPVDGIAPPAVQPEIRCIGINVDDRYPGLRMYRYGATSSDTSDRITGGLCGVICNVSIGAGKSAKYGELQYLNVLMQTPTPGLLHLLKLPCGKNQHSYRSLLAALLKLTGELDLSATALRIDAKPGTRDPRVTLFQVSLNPSGDNPIVGPKFPEGRDALEMAVNRLRCCLGHPPQFP